MGMFDGLLSALGLGGNSADAKPNLPTNVDVGSTPPQMPSYADFHNGYRTASVLHGMGNGYMDGLAALFGPDTSASAYNAMIRDATATKMGQYGLPKAALESGMYDGTIDRATGLPKGQAQRAPAAAPAAPGIGDPSDPMNAELKQRDSSAFAMPAPPAGMQYGGGIGSAAPNLVASLAGAGGAAGAAPGPAMLTGAAPPQPGDGINRLLGVPTPANMPTDAAFLASKFAPDLFKEFAASQFTTRRGGSTGIGPNGEPLYTPIGEAGVSVPPGHPDFLRQFSNVKGIAAAATGNQTRLTANQAYKAEYGVDSPNVTTSQPGAGITGSGVLPPNRDRAAAARRANAGQADLPPTAPVAPITSEQLPAPTAAAPASGAGPMTSAQGSIIPPVSDAAPIINSGAYLKTRQPQWADTENAWGNSIAPNQMAEQKTRAIMEAFKLTQSGEGAEGLAKAKAVLMAAGVPADKINWGDPAQVQIALKDNFAEALADIRAFSSKGSQMEVLGAVKNFAHPNNQPEANHSIGAQAIGTLLWNRQMATDWAEAKALPADPVTGKTWKDPQDFARAWAKRNPLQGFIDQASKDIGPLMGEKGGPVAPGTPISKENAAEAANLRQNYRLLSPADQAKQRAGFIKKLQDLGYN